MGLRGLRLWIFIFYKIKSALKVINSSNFFLDTQYLYKSSTFAWWYTRSPFCVMDGCHLFALQNTVISTTFFSLYLYLPLFFSLSVSFSLSLSLSPSLSLSLSFPPYCVSMGVFVPVLFHIWIIDNLENFQN